MNPDFLGDSYDLVKRFFCRELVALRYEVVVDPMFTGAWGDKATQFYRLIGVAPEAVGAAATARAALFLDPDTGVNSNGGEQHVSFDRIVSEATTHDLVFSFDQSFSRQAKPRDVMQAKLAAVSSRGGRAMYYDSHARFLFVSLKEHPLQELREHLVSLGLPAERLLEST